MSRNAEAAGQPDVGQRVLNAVKRNPEGLLLLAAGCALMLRTRSSLRRNGQTHREDGYSGARESTDGGMSRTATQAADRAKEFAGQATERMGETAKSYAASASDLAHEATRKASHYAEDASRQASEYGEKLVVEAQSTFRSTVDYIVREQPLAIVAMGLAAGAAVASVLPPTEMEKEALGEVGARVTEAVKERSEGVKEAVMKAGERLKDAAEDPSKLQDNLSKSAEDVSGALSGRQEGEPGSGDTKKAGATGAETRNMSGVEPVGRG